MLSDKLNEDKFDEILRRALRGHTEPVPSDFTAGLLRQIEQAQERRILAQVVLEERLALVGCILLGIIIISAAVVFPGTVAGFTGQVKTLTDRIGQVVEFVSSWRQLYMVFAAMFGFAVYSLVDLLIGDS
jgi:hypothetical protein